MIPIFWFIISTLELPHILVVNAFNRSGDHFKAPSRKTCLSKHLKNTLLLAQDSPSASDEGNDTEKEELILQELMEMKKAMFGTEIPSSDELKLAAKNAEKEFLEAMMMQSKQFQRIKSKRGPDDAVELFMKKIQNEQNPSFSDPEGDSDDKDDNVVEDRWFVQRMQEEQNSDTECNAKNKERINDDSWQ